MSLEVYNNYVAIIYSDVTFIMHYAKPLLQVFSIVISAFRTELFSAATFPVFPPPSSTDRDLPLGICFYQESDDDIYGDRICNNAMAASVVSILVAIVLLMIDLQVPCVSSTVSEQCNVVVILLDICVHNDFI